MACNVEGMLQLLLILELFASILKVKKRHIKFWRCLVVSAVGLFASQGTDAFAVFGSKES
ncbi:hypothetical protein KY285_000128 [Solanum tuberosum]|nr:hypothetical protein KY284_000138 [Solanum tuberosum]KAH0764257.1 hypothetical protein KY285_000128 [Solanum tuberosum]